MIGTPANNGIATGALVTGIISQVLAILFIMLPSGGMGAIIASIGSLVAGLVALVMGIVGISESRERMGAGRGKAVTGLVLGLLTVAFRILLIGASLYVSTHEPSGGSTQQVAQGGQENPSSQSDPSDAGDRLADGDNTSPSSPATDSVTPDQLDSMLSGPIWECHVDSGEIGAKFTFDSSDHSYVYWRGDADPVTQTGDRISGHYEIYFDEDAYAFLDGYNGSGDGMRQQASGISESRGEPVHYFVLMTTPESENISGVESPMTESDAVMWDGVWMTESKHMQIVNANTANSYDVYDSTVPTEERETALARLFDMQEQLVSDDE